MPLILRAHANPNIVGRLGRLIYWTALFFAALLLLLAYMAFTAPIPQQNPQGVYVSHGLPGETFLFFAVTVAVVGRGFRYLLAGE